MNMLLHSEPLVGFQILLTAEGLARKSTAEPFQLG
jgi:hypothetical protein